MFGVVKIGDKDVEMLANAASPYIYKQLFHQDFLTELQKDDPDVDLFQKMGYVMAKQAEIQSQSKLMKLTIDGFYEWLTGFDAMAIMYAVDQIADIYMYQTKGTSAPKNEGE